jgi:outer membrane protein assembly complex protein YaeT
VTIDEGRQFRYGDKSVGGSFDTTFGWRFGHMVRRLETGEPVNLFELSDLKSQMKELLANRGYPYATIKHTVDTTGRPDSCDINFTINSDSLVHFGAVEIRGASNYPEYAARRELKIEPGKIYRREDILESQRRLFESGYYTTFQLRQAEDSEDRYRPDFVLRLRERRTRSLTFKAGAAQSEVRDLQWDISAAYGKRNFLGSRRYDILSDYSFAVGKDSRLIKHRYRLRLTEPWFLGIRMPVTLTGEVEPRTKDAVQDFNKRSWSGSVVITKWFARKVRVILGTEYRFVKISGASQEIIEEAKTLEGNSARRKLYGSFRRDSRDDIFVPSSGSVTELRGEYYGGFLKGDASFFKVQAEWSRYRKVWPGWISATRLRLGWAEAFGETKSVPLDEALYLGGANTVRGFEENHLGPLREDGTPAGARYIAVFNQEFRWKTVQFLNILPLIGDVFETMPLWQSAFVDVGNGFRNKQVIKLDNVAVSVGSGFQIISPAGPIRFDYARVLDTENFDFAERWHFTILYAF